MRYTPMRYTPMKYTPVRCTPVRYTPMRHTLVRCLPVRCTPVRFRLLCKVHACICKMHVYEIYIAVGIHLGGTRLVDVRL